VRIIEERKYGNFAVWSIIRLFKKKKEERNK